MSRIFKLTAVITGVTGKKQTNDEIGKTLEDLAALSAVIDPTT